MNEAIEHAARYVGDVLDQSFWALESAEMVEQLGGLEDLITRARAAQGLLIRELGGRNWDGQCGATSLPVWLRNRVRVSLPGARRVVRLGAQIDARPQIRAAIKGGAVNAEQAAVIDQVITGLPSDLDAAVVDECEATLIGFAAEFEPAALRTLGARILDHVAPEIAEAALAAKLDRQEAEARRTRSLTIRDNGDGSHGVKGKLDTESAAVVRAAIDALCQPIPATAGERDERTAGQRRADALVDVCRFAMAHDDLPVNGGNRPQLNVTVSFDVLSRELSCGTLDIGGIISATAVRRLACDAAILPAVLGSRGEILDLGRERRLYSGAARRALVLRDGGCAFPGCDRPPRWCEGHHILSWQGGGATNVANGVLLCAHHHRLIHEPDGWQARMGADGLPEFIPPCWVDPTRTPRRNLLHLRT